MAEKSRNNSFLSKLAVGLIFAVVVIYTAYHLISLFSSEDIKTIISGVTTEKIMIGGDGYVFRDESVLHSYNAGAVDYIAENGGKVSSREALARIYKSGEGTDVRSFISTLDSQIEILEKCSGDGIANVDLSELRKSADATYFTLTDLLASGEAGELYYQIEKMMITLSRIHALTDGDASTLEALDILRAERESWLSGEYDETYSDRSGYFYWSVDGYENNFSISALENLDGDQFYELIAMTRNSDTKVPPTVYGKLASDSRWKFVLPLEREDAELFSEGQEYNVTFPENNNTAFLMMLEKKMYSEERGTVVLVFGCNRLPDNFNFERCMTAQIELSSYSGIYVPRSAIERVNGELGVYVLRGNVTTFRRIDIIYEGSDYVLVSERNDSDGKYYYLGSNEQIIINGKNLFDGRIVE